MVAPIFREATISIATILCGKLLLCWSCGFRFSLAGSAFFFCFLAGIFNVNADCLHGVLDSNLGPYLQLTCYFCGSILRYFPFLFALLDNDDIIL